MKVMTVKGDHREIVITAAIDVTTLSELVDDGENFWMTGAQIDLLSDHYPWFFHHFNFTSEDSRHITATYSNRKGRTIAQLRGGHTCNRVDITDLTFILGLDIRPNR